jgi:hypothetical protein
MSWTIWLVALAAYVLFRAWYDNWRGPLKTDEIDVFVRRLQGTKSAESSDLGVLRKFLEADDGREFVMLNLVRVEGGDVPHPVTGAATPGKDLLQIYVRSFMPALFRRGGHPAIVGRKIGGYVDAWNVSPDPGWTIMGYMRYRSRRDLMHLVSDPRFLEMHPFKMAGTAGTFSFPTRPVMLLFVSPRVWVGLLVLVVASFAQIAALLAGAGK